MSQAEEPGGERALHRVLRDPGYGKLLLLAALLGVPVSLVAFGFLALEHAVQHWLWTELPHHWGWSRAPLWWPLPLLAVAGSVVAGVVARLPGRGGHVPAHGTVGEPVSAAALPGVVLAGLVSLSFGAVLGPEAPLLAIGGGLALLAARARRRDGAPGLDAVVSATGGAAAISTVFGNPLIAVVLILEAAGLGGPRLIALVLPCLLASGIGALVVTGFRDWSGLDTGTLSLPSVPPAGTLGAGDFLWGVLLAAAIACGVVAATRGGRGTAAWTLRRPASRTVLCALAVGVLLAAYALCTGRSPEEAALSGQAALADLAARPTAWPVPVLAWLLLFKGLAWTVSLGALRGGAVFPALTLGSALTTICAGLPGFGVTSGLAVGLAAAGAAVTRLPVTASILATLLLGSDAPGQMPLVIVASVVAFVVGELLRSRRRWRGTSAEPPADAAPARGSPPVG
ncbi:chloride channel protein [Streptomyces sp. NPDC095613]|uniref:chloride channel protein n=1 Tax=Streptomyces sp. NPDC095613 TaxID=3155540 RepID=UPI00332FC1CD